MATKAEQLDAEKISESNPDVDLDQLREAQALVSDLRARGLPGPSYDIRSPYERRRVRVKRSRLSG